MSVRPPPIESAAPAGRHVASGRAVIRAWLLVVALMVYGMILVGGATRLTDSGLSITEWKPILGAIPPLSDADWNEAFEKYRSMTAEYRLQNAGMSMEAFREIYWWEWGHRQLGRTIGLVVILPLLAFQFLGWLDARLRWRLLALLAMGGLQGFIGWWMVASGVGDTDRLDVAPYRLMTHFGLALVIICYCLWLWLDLGADAPATSRPARGWARLLLGVAGLQMLLGALVAGLDAGRGYIDWPLMAGRIVPEAMWALEPVWRNLFENEATTQFLHRTTAYLLCGLAVFAVVRNRGQAGFVWLAALVGLQAVLGVVTLVHAAPLNLSLLHQGLGVVVLLAALRLAWRTRKQEARA